MNCNSERSQFWFYLILIYFFFEFARPFDWLPMLKVFRIPMILTLLIVFSVFYRLDVVMSAKTKLGNYMLLFVGYTILSGIWAELTVAWYKCSKGAVLLLSVYYFGVLAHVDSKKQLTVLVDVLLVCHVFAAIWSLFNGGRGPGGFLEDENDFGCAMVSMLPFYLFLAEKEGLSKLKRIFVYLAIPIILVSIVNANSRGSFLGLVAVLLVVFIFTKNRSRYIGLAMLGVSIAAIQLSDEYIQQLESIADYDSGTADERLWQWKLGFDMFLDHPIIGVGQCNYPYWVGSYEELGLGGRWGDIRKSIANRVAHSVYFSVLPELGLIGSFLFAATTFVYFRQLRDFKKNSLSELADIDWIINSLIAGMVGYLVCAIFITALWGYGHYWFFICAVVVLIKIVNNRTHRGGSVV